MSALVVVAPLKPGSHERAKELIDAGPPFTLADSRFDSHDVFLTTNEVVFVFEGKADAGETLTFDADDPIIGRAAQAWRECIDGRPRVALAAFSWKREQPAG